MSRGQSLRLFDCINVIFVPSSLFEPQERTPSVALQALKLGFARRVLAERRRQRNSAQGELFAHTPQHLWQARFYDPSASLRISAAGSDAR